MTPSTLVVVPAYGRDYRNKREVLAAWDGGADFLTQTWGVSGYVSKREVPAGCAVEIRYRKLQHVVWIPPAR